MDTVTVLLIMIVSLGRRAPIHRRIGTAAVAGVVFSFGAGRMHGELLLLSRSDLVNVESSRCRGPCG
ncbi:MAG: hypothetical protein ABIN08_12415 [Caldimonas sp.]